MILSMEFRKFLAMDLPDDLKFIPGIEISCDALHREIHVLGYGINYKDQQLNQTHQHAPRQTVSEKS